MTGTPGVQGPDLFTFSQTENSLSGTTPQGLTLTGNVGDLNIAFSWIGIDGVVNIYTGTISGSGTISGTWTSSNGKSGTWSAIIVTTPAIIVGRWNIFYTTAGTPGEQGPFLIAFTQNVNSISGTTSIGGQPITVTGSVSNESILFAWTGSDGVSNIFTGTVGVNGTMSGTWISTNGLSGTWRAAVI